MRVSKSRVWLRRSLAVALPMLVLYVPAGFVESASHGPYTRWFNGRMYQRAQAAHLVGADEAAVVAAIGEPSYVWRYWSVYRGNEPAPGAEHIITYNYMSHVFAPYGKFQVHFRYGRVSGLEQLDD
jgi:hypothetical protein